MNENIIQLDTIRIDRHKPRKCTCTVRKFTVDTVNREIECSCGILVDPFEAMAYLAALYDRINDEHRALNEQRQRWIKEKPYSVIFKRLERDYCRGEMLPSCPVCKQTFDFKDVTFFTNAKLFRKRQEKVGEGQ